MAKRAIPGLDDGKIILLTCPRCRKALQVTNFRRGPLDKIRGIHEVKQYGWHAICNECGDEWGSMTDARVAPSLWVLKDIVEEE